MVVDLCLYISFPFLDRGCLDSFLWVRSMHLDQAITVFVLLASRVQSSSIPNKSAEEIRR